MAATTYTTDFNLNESPIAEGGTWKHAGLDWTRIVTGAGIAYGSQTGSGGYDDSYAYLSGFSADQAASAVVHVNQAIDHSTTHEVEILLRWVDSAHSSRGYECNFAYDGRYADIVRWNGPKSNFTFLLPTGSAHLAGALREGDVVGAQIVGNLITTFVNGVQILSVTDDVYKDGNPGMGFWRGAPSGPVNDVAFTRFTATALSAPGTTVPAVPGWGALFGFIVVGMAGVRARRVYFSAALRRRCG